MKTKFLHPIRRLYITAAAFLAGIAGASAYDYTGYDYVEEFNAPLSTGALRETSGAAIGVSNGDARHKYGYALRAGETESDSAFYHATKDVDANAGADRSATLLLGKQVDFAQSIAVEFDWFSKNVTGADYYFSFRDAANSNLFTVYCPTSGYFGLVAGSDAWADAAGGSKQLISEAGATLPADGAWFHIKAVISKVSQTIVFTVTGAEDYTKELTLAYTGDHANIYRFFSNAAKNSKFYSQIDNLGIKVLDSFGDPITGITIAGASAVSKDQSIDLTATVEPVTALDSVTWSVQGSGILSLAVTGRLACSVTGLSLGTDTVVATAGDGSGVVAKHAVKVTPTLVSSITIGGDNQLKTHYLPAGAIDSLFLTATVAPDTAADKTYTWASNRPAVAAVTQDGKVVITAATLDTVTITATAGDDGRASAAYTFIVDSRGLTSAAYDYTSGYGYIDLYNNGSDYANGETSYSSLAYGAPLYYNASTLGLKFQLSNSNLGRRNYFKFNKVVEASQVLVVEFDWYATTLTGGSEATREAQITLMDGYTMGRSTAIATHEIFTIYHVQDISNEFGVVAGPIYEDISQTVSDFNSADDHGYFASRKGASTVEAHRKVITASLSEWYHIKAEIDIVALKIKFTITKTADGANVAAFELPLPSNFSMVDGPGKLLCNLSGTGGSATVDDMIDNLAIKNADVLTPGQKATGVSITQVDNVTTVIAGKTTQLTVKVLPVDAENKKITWSSTNSLYATVDQEGLVSGLLAGVDSTVGIVATATDGSGVADTFFIDVIAQPITGITVSGDATLYMVSAGETRTYTASISPSDATNKELTWTTASGGDKVSIVSVNATTDTVIVRLNAVGPDTIIATAADGQHFTTGKPVQVELNPYPGYSYVETFDAGLNGSEEGLRGDPTSIDVKDADNIDDKVLLYYDTNTGAARAGTYNFNAVTSFTTKAVVEFDFSIIAKSSGEGILSFMSNTPVNGAGDTINQDVFSIFAVNDATGFGVSAGYISKEAHSSSYYEYVNEPRRAQTSVDAANRAWVVDTIGTGIWYHAKVEIYVGERIAFTFTRDTDTGTDTSRVLLPFPSGTKTSLGSINLAGVGVGSWTALVDNVGIRVADSDPSVSPTGVKVSSEYDRVASNGGTIPVTASVLPWDVTSHAVEWGVVDQTIATVAVDAGNPSWVATLTGLADGTAKVFAKVTGTNIADTLSVPVQVITVDSLYIQGSTSVSVGHSITITKSNDEVWPANAGNKSVTWTTSNAGIASIESIGDTCIVTGVSAGANEQDSVLIIATAADGGGAADTIKVYVSFTHATRLDLWGDRRVFYTASPAGTTIALTPSFIPSTSSDTVITGWESTNSDILTVSGAGVATLAGGYGKAAVKATARDGGLAGYYCVEVAQASPYDEFNDFESPMSNASDLKLDTFAFVTNGGSASYTTFRNTGAVKLEAENTNTRGLATQLVDAIGGERVILRFDFFAGKSGGQNGTKFNYGSISIQDNLTAPASSSVNSGYVNRYLTIAFVPDTLPGHNFFYFVDAKNSNNETITLFSAEYPGDADGLPGSQDTRDNIEWGFLPELSTLDAWYTLEATIDNYLHTVSFTITETDAPEHTQTVTSIPLSSTFESSVGSIYVLSRRDGTTSSASLTSAIDNFGYKAYAVLEHITVTLHPEEGVFTDDESTVDRELPAIAAEALVNLPEVSRTGYTFAGWRYANGTAYSPTDVYATDTALYAAWEIICYTVHYEGVELPDTCVNHGAAAVQPEDPERECYEFTGWYYPNGNPWYFNTAITGPVTIVAQWEELDDCEGDDPTSVASGTLAGVALYPNPAGSTVTITGLTDGETVELISISGTLLLSRKATGDKETIDVSSLLSGAYLVRIAKGTVKLIKN